MLYEKIKNILSNLEINYYEIEHPESKTCEDSKKFREEAWISWIWSKNIVFHCKWNFYLVTTIWDKDIKARNFKKEFWSKDIRFASQDEISKVLWNETKIWSIPPFGFENSEIPVFVDEEIFANEFFMFNPWISTKTIRIKSKDLEKVYKNMQNIVKLFKVTPEEFFVKEI